MENSSTSIRWCTAHNERALDATTCLEGLPRGDFCDISVRLLDHLNGSLLQLFSPATGFSI